VALKEGLHPSISPCSKHRILLGFKAGVGAQRLNLPFNCCRALKERGRKSAPPQAVSPNFLPLSFRPWEAPAKQGFVLAPPGNVGFTPRVCKTQEDAMRYTEQEIETMEEYEALKSNHAEIEKSLWSERLWLEERNALEHLLDLSAGDLEDARAEYYSAYLAGHP
jgi:hypothetical protein